MYYKINIKDDVVVVVVQLLYCYIIDWYLLDKVIDLVDEVVVKFWLEMNFMFEEFDEVECWICQFEIEWEVMCWENDEFKISSINEELVNFEEDCNVLKVQWESEWEVIFGVQ